MTNINQTGFLSLTLLTASLALHGMAQSTLTEFDAPRAAIVSSPACAPSCGTIALANNTSGLIVGYYTDTYIVPHGFVRTPDGHMISFDAPGAGLGAGLDQGTVAYSVNELGVIAGQFEDANDVFHGFVRLPEGYFSAFDAPGAGTGAYQGTLAFSINPEGATAGIYIDGNSVVHGFVRSHDGGISSFDPSGSVYTYPCEETCLSQDGANNTFHGFLRDPDGTIREFDAPGGGTGNYLGTVAASINPDGTITGYVEDSNAVAHGFARARDGSFTTFDVPGAGTGPGQGTLAFSISSLGAIAGEFLDANNAMHGFARSARGILVPFDAPDAGTGAGQGTRPSTNNGKAAVAGWYVDTNSLNHGFVWNP
jgi:hypothetical protein